MKFNKTTALLLSIALFASTQVFAVDGLTADAKQKVSDGLNSFATELLSVVPESSTQQNVWADAYIGKLFPSLPPHFGGGLTIGGSMLDMTGFKDAATALTEGYNEAARGISSITSLFGEEAIPQLDFGKIPDSFPMPTATVDIRIGGFFLPFDIGICAMMTNPSLFNVDLSKPKSIMDMSSSMNGEFMGYNGSINYITLGADFRYCVLEENLVLPSISLGAGYIFTKGDFGVSTDSSTAVGSYTIDTAANMNMSFQTHVLFLQAQVSKSLAIVTLYGGARGLLTNSTNSWAWNYKTSNGDTVLTESSDEGTVSSGNGISDSYQDGKFDFSAIQPQLYAGVGFNFLMFQTSLGACVDVSSFFRDTGKYLWSGSFSVRAKI